MVEKTEYDGEGSQITKVYDERFDSPCTEYAYTNDLVTARTEQNGQTYRYTYDPANDNMTSVSAAVSTRTPENDFAYTNGYLTKVTHNGFDFGFAYDGLGRNSRISAGGSTLVSLAYTSGAQSTVTSALCPNTLF